MSSDGVSAKTIMRWTGASERAVKGWVGGKPGPRGEHLIALMAESDIVFLTVLRLARRDRAEHSPDLDAVRDYLRQALSALDEPVPDGGPDNAERRLPVPCLFSSRRAVKLGAIPPGANIVDQAPEAGPAEPHRKRGDKAHYARA